MRHHAEHISSRTTDSGNVIQRPVRTRFSRDLSSLIAIAEHNAIIAPQLRQCRLIAEIIAFHVPDRNAKHITFAARACERGAGILHAHMHRLAHILQSGIAHESARQQPGFAQNLKSIADSEHQPSAIGKFAHRFHYRREPRDRPRTQIVAVSKASGHDDGVAIFEIV